jgi:hypothetical protein
VASLPDEGGRENPNLTQDVYKPLTAWCVVFFPHIFTPNLSTHYNICVFSIM